MVAFVMRGEPSGLYEPNWIPLPPGGFPPIEAPFCAYWVGPEALMVTEGLRPKSPDPEVELVGVLPFTIVGVPTAGTAGGIATLPFTGELVPDFPCWCAGEAGDGFAPDDAGGGEKGFRDEVAWLERLPAEPAA